MAEGWSAASANAFLAAALQGVAFSYGGVWVQLHTAAPGPAGTANIATNNVRADASTAWDAPAGGVSVTLSNIGGTEWASVPASETYTHATLWDDPTAGTFIGSGALVVAAVTIGDSFYIPAGDLTATQPIAA